MSNIRMNRDELAEYTHLTKYQVDMARKQGKIPYIQIGRRILYDPEMVEEALELEALENQRRQRELAEAAQPKEVVHYGNYKKIKELIG